MSERLKGKVALVIGAGTEGGGWGNGKAAAVCFAREGARVIAADIQLEAAGETADVIRSEGGDCTACQADVSDAASVARLIDFAVKACGRIDILHNNVGIPGPVTGIDGTCLEQWERVLRVNTSGAFLSCKAVLPVMVRQGGGAIINVSSVAGLGVPRVLNLAYGTSKSAMNYFTRSIAIEYAARGVRANVIAPGLMDTPIVRNAKGMVAQYADENDMAEQRHAMSPTGRMGSPWDIGKAAVFLASDDAKYINGVVLPVDGGLSCKIG